MKIALGPLVFSLLDLYIEEAVALLWGLLLFAITSLQSKISPRLKILPAELP